MARATINATEKPEQLDLIPDYGQHARATRRQAMQRKRSPKLESALRAVRAAGTEGLTREQIADRIGIPLQSVCSPALALLKDRSIVESDRKRKTRQGEWAAVLVAAEYAPKLLAVDDVEPITTAAPDDTDTKPVGNLPKFNRELCWNAHYMRFRRERLKIKPVLDDADLLALDKATRAAVEAAELRAMEGGKQRG